MSRPIIEVRNLSKRYRLGAIGMTSLREEIHRWWESLKSWKAENGNQASDLRSPTFDL